MIPAQAFLLATLTEGVTETQFGGTPGPDLTQYGLVITAMLVVTGVVAWGFKRLLSGTLKTRASERSLQVMDVLPLSGKQRLCVVRCYDRSFFLGVSEKGVSLISELDAAIEPKKKPAPKTADQAAFLRALQRVNKQELLARVAQAGAGKTRRAGKDASAAAKDAPAAAKVAPAVAKVAPAPAPKTVTPAAPRRRVKRRPATALPVERAEQQEMPRRRRVRRVVPEQVQDEFPPVGGLLA